MAHPPSTYVFWLTPINSVAHPTGIGTLLAEKPFSSIQPRWVTAVEVMEVSTGLGFSRRRTYRGRNGRETPFWCLAFRRAACEHRSSIAVSL